MVLTCAVRMGRWVACVHCRQRQTVHQGIVKAGSNVPHQKVTLSLMLNRFVSYLLEHCCTCAAHAYTHSCCQLPYLQPVLAATKPAILIMTSFHTEAGPCHQSPAILITTSLATEAKPSVTDAFKYIRLGYYQASDSQRK